MKSVTLKGLEESERKELSETLDDSEGHIRLHIQNMNQGSSALRYLMTADFLEYDDVKHAQDIVYELTEKLYKKLELVKKVYNFVNYDRYKTTARYKLTGKKPPEIILTDEDMKEANRILNRLGINLVLE